MYADIVALQKNLKARIEIYRSTHKRDPNLSAVAQMLSVTLYMRRFFPYYAFNILAGLRDDGVFTCYGYDAVGSFDEAQYGAQGSGNQLITPVLDNLIIRNPNLNETDAVKLVLETMNGTSCRDIFTGDKVEMMILRADGQLSVREEDLRKD
jgi:20S proteasome subunit beta 6